MTATDIKKLRAKFKLTQEDFAHMLGVTFQTVNRWERGASKPSRLALNKMNQLKDKEDETSKVC